MRCLFSVEFPFFLRMIHVRYECRTSQSHLGKDVDFFRYHKTKSVYSRRLRRTRKRRNAENSFYQFHRPMTTEYMMNSYWTILLDRKLHSTNSKNYAIQVAKATILTLEKWEKRPETKTEKTVRFGRKLEAQSTEQLLKFYSSNFSVRILAAHLKNETFPHAKGKIALYVRENQTDAQLTKLAEKIFANKVLSAFFYFRWKRTNISFEMQTSQFFPLANAFWASHEHGFQNFCSTQKCILCSYMNNIYIFS